MLLQPELAQAASSPSAATPAQMDVVHSQGQKRERAPTVDAEEMGSVAAANHYVKQKHSMDEPASVYDAKWQILDHQLVEDGRRTEIQHMLDFGAFVPVGRAEAKGYRIFTHRWVDKQKGPLVRPRLCCRDYAVEKLGGIFTGAPSLTAARELSWRALRKRCPKKRADVSVAFVHADEPDRAYMTAPVEMGLSDFM
eukprot:8516001-Alexandrium_andersonii.AAC.1